MGPGQEGQVRQTIPHPRSQLNWRSACLLFGLVATVLITGTGTRNRALSSQDAASEQPEEWSGSIKQLRSSLHSPQMTRGRGMNLGFSDRRSGLEFYEDDFSPVPPAPQREWLRKRQQNEFRPGEPWLDDKGLLIQAHGGGVIFHNGTYYWFGEHKAGITYTRYTEAYSPPRVDVIGVGCYSSQDLLHWKNEGLALRANTHPDLVPANVLERPKVLYHRKLRKFVMWMHVDTGDYEWARVGIAVADSVTGPYTYLHSFRPHNQQARDLTIFQDDDDSAYIAYSSEDNSVMHVSRLTADYLGVEPRYRRILVLLKREAPAMFKFKHIYLLFTSGCTSWAPNRAEVFYATDVMGQWKSLGNPAAGGDQMDRAFTFFSQPTFVVPVHGKPGRYVLMADQWDTTNLGASRYAWLPMWVEEVPPEKLARATEEWNLGRALHLRLGGSSYYTVPPGPLHIVVPWMSSWKPEVLDQELDPEIKETHWKEQRTYPLAVPNTVKS